MLYGSCWLVGKRVMIMSKNDKKILKWNENNVTDVDFPETIITAEDLENQRVVTRGSMRISMGRVYTKEAWNKKRDKVLSTPLP